MAAGKRRLKERKGQRAVNQALVAMLGDREGLKTGRGPDHAAGPERAAAQRRAHC